ncbi:MAG: 2-C-methyl-D-erythritol 2,4-cyclodiphosphate synthase [Bacteroidota bacterium]
MKIRIGFGFDVHPLAEGIPFMLGGVLIKHNKGAAGHSDADVLIHAICDAMLGAAGLRDIGCLFPDTDSAYKGIDSRILLKEVSNHIKREGYSIGNIDSTICLQSPKIKDHIPAMINALAGVLEIPTGDISIKATTTEKLGYIGREEGVSAYASVLLTKKPA